MYWFTKSYSNIVDIISGIGHMRLLYLSMIYIFISHTINVMPIGAVGTAAIAAGSAILGQGANAYFIGKSNRKTRKWNEKMYERQRIDAMADWNMQNEYNSPKAEMERLRAAGLNPHLVYGNGGATNEASPVRSASVESWRPETPQFDLGQAVSGGMSAYYDTKIKEAQSDNLTAQLEVIKMDAALRAAQVGSTIASTEKTGFETSLAKELKTISLESASQQLKKLQADTEYTVDNNERQKALSQSTLQKAAEEILNLRASRAGTEAQTKQTREQIQNLRKDGVLKDLEIKLKQVGMSWQDPAWMRFLQQNIGLDPKQIREKADKFLKDAMKMGLGGEKRYTDTLEQGKGYPGGKYKFLVP